MDADQAPLSFLGRRLSPRFERRMIVLMPGQSWSYEQAEWQGAIIVVEQGAIELECLDGSRYSFRRGHVLWLEQLPLRALHNPEQTPTVLLAISRTHNS